MKILNPILVEPKEKHFASVIFLHGLGDSGISWVQLSDSLGDCFPNIKWIFPNAPLRPVSFNGGVPIPAWFNVASFDKSSQTEKLDEAGMLSSVKIVEEIIEKEKNLGISNIILGGFSQGCVISLLTGLTTKIPLSGIIGVSGWLPMGEKITSMASEANKKVPLLICHGDDDPIVKYRYGRASARYLNKIGYRVEFKSYEGLGHTINAKEIDDIGNFVHSILTSTSKL
ncbi:unnamed protein product [Cunninghamella blakesleeana]